MDCKGAKKSWWYFSKTLLQKREKNSQEAIDLAVNFFQGDEFSCQMTIEKDCASVWDKIQKQKCLVLCNLHEIYAAFKEKI